MNLEELLDEDVLLEKAVKRQYQQLLSERSNPLGSLLAKRSKSTVHDLDRTYDNSNLDPVKVSFLSHLTQNQETDRNTSGMKKLNKIKERKKQLLNFLTEFHKQEEVELATSEEHKRKVEELS